MNPDFDRARKCALHYRKLGLCPLPSRMVKPKGPMLPSYAEHYQGVPVPEAIYGNKWATTNIQIITGTNSPTPTKIIVVDCDGDEAIGRWDEILAHHRYCPDRSWISVTGSGGIHTYFTLPADVKSCPSGMIWGLWDTWGDDGKGKWSRHKEIRILADNALVIAPPSIHVDTGRRYEFTGMQNPNRMRLPETAPEWLLKLPRLLASPRLHEPPKPSAQRPQNSFRSGRHYCREEVLEAVGDKKCDIAREWGLVFRGNGPNPSGWCQCFVPGREDPSRSTPSGSFNFADGTLQDRKTLETVSFFDLAVILGAHQTWQEARDSLGDRFIGRRTSVPAYKYVF